METLVDRWNSLAESWWDWAWPQAWQAALVAGLVLVLLRLGRRWPAPLRYGLVLVALLKFVTPPLVSLPTGVFSHVTVGESSPSAVDVELAAGSGRVPEPRPSAAASIAPAARGADLGGETRSTPSPRSAWTRIEPLALVFALYLAGVLVAGVRLARHALEIHAERRRARAPARAFRLQHEALARALGFRRVPELCISRSAGPMAIGLFSGAVLVPRALARLGAEERAAILAHELVHHRRRDLVVAWLTALVKALWWWHPAALALSRAARVTREECCDDVVLERGLVERETYCRSLLRAACVMGIGRSGALAAAYHEHSLGARFRRLFDETRSHRGRLGAPAWGLVTAAGLVLLPGLGRPAPAQARATARELQGVVLDPAGKPVAGASVFLSKDAGDAAPRATSDAQGRFRLGLDAGQAADKYLSVVAMAQGFGLAWEPTHEVADVKLRLAPDTAPVRGRVVDLEGRPVPGAQASLIFAGIFPEGGLEAWLEGVADGTAPFHGMAEVAVQKKRSWWLAGAPQVRATTDQDGRFELRGVGADRLAIVLIEKPGLASAALRVITREIDTVICPTREDGGFGLVYRGSSFVHHVTPAREVSGTVTDAAGKPIAGAEVRALVPESPEQVGDTSAGMPGLTVGPHYFRTKTDAQGRYGFHNLPLDPGVSLLFDGHEAGFHLVLHELDDVRELRSQTRDAVLAPTIRVAGRVIDERGKPVARVNLDYHPASGAGGMKMKEMIDPLSAPHFHAQSDEQGRFELRLPEGRGVVAARAGEEYAGISGLSDEEAKELEVEFDLWPGTAAFCRLDVKTGGQAPEPELVLRDAPTRRIEFVDPDGKPLAGVRVCDENPSSYSFGDLPEPLPEAHCEIRGEISRPIIAVHRERNLIGAIHASAVGEGPIRFQLVPAATIVGRLVDVDGLPVPRVDLDVQGTPGSPKLEKRWPSMVLVSMLGVDWYHGQRLLTDDEGRFRLSPLVPGWTYSLADAQDMNDLGRLGAPVTPGPGETVDLGDVQAKKE